MGGFTTFEIGGITIPISSAHELSQSYQPLGGFQTIRMMDGGLVKQQNWEKIATTISGEGVIPPGLESLDYCSALLMKCAAPRGVTSTLPTGIAVPPARRTDPGFSPIGCAWIPRTDEPSLGQWVTTTISIISDVATLGVVAGATQYRVEFFPEITVFADRPQQDVDVHGANHSWTLEAEQV